MSERGARGRGRSRAGRSGARGVGSRGGNGYQGGNGTKTQSPWWAELSGVCPISLVPVAELDNAPFALCAEAPAKSKSAGSGVIHYFDARFLANWMVSSGDLSDPMNRRPLTRQECLALDEHMRSFHPEMSVVSVTDAFDFQSRQHIRTDNVSGAGLAGQSLQREANLVLQSLFQWRHRGSSIQAPRDAAGHRVVFHESGLRVVDDNDVEAPEVEQELSNEDEAFPVLSDRQSARLAEEPQWPAPAAVRTSASSLAAPPVQTDEQHAHQQQPKPRPRLQLKKRSEDLGPVGSGVCESNQRSALFGTARPREEKCDEAGGGAEAHLSTPPRKSWLNLCTYSRYAIVYVVHDQQLRTRWLAPVEIEVQRFIENMSCHSLELEAASHMHCFLIRELCFHSLLDVEVTGNTLEGVRTMRVMKTGTARTPSIWLSEAATTFAYHVLPVEDLPVLPSRPFDFTLLLTYCGPPGQGKGLESALHEVCQAADHDEPRRLMGGRHVLLRFARRSAAQKCCSKLSPGSRKSCLWVAECWSGDVEWAAWQLQQLAKASSTGKGKPTKGEGVSARDFAERAAAAPPVAATAVVGGQWGALLDDEEGSDTIDEA